MKNLALFAIFAVVLFAGCQFPEIVIETGEGIEVGNTVFFFYTDTGTVSIQNYNAHSIRATVILKGEYAGQDFVLLDNFSVYDHATRNCRLQSGDVIDIFVDVWDSENGWRRFAKYGVIIG